MILGSGKPAFLFKILGHMVLYGVMVYFMAMNTEEKKTIQGVGGRLGRMLLLK